MPQTPNYNLPLFTANDIPSWLTDWNQSMEVIDSALASIQADATGQGANVEALQTNVQTINTSLVNLTNRMTTLSEELVKKHNFKYVSPNFTEINIATVSGTNTPTYTTIPTAGFGLLKLKVTGEAQNLASIYLNDVHIVYERRTEIDVTYMLWLEKNDRLGGLFTRQETGTLKLELHPYI